MRYFICLFALLMLLAWSCKDEGTNPIDRNYVIPDTNVSYYEDLQPMFYGKCGYGSACHSVDNPDNTLFFGDKIIFMNYSISRTGEKLVDLELWKNPKQQPLYLIVTEGYAGIVRMPPITYGREWLNKNQIEGIEQWIREGAND